MANRIGRPRNLSKIGSVFGRLTIVSPTHKNKYPAWECLCSCGNKHIVKNSDLKNTKSCGCYRRELKRNTSHGEYGTPTYECWHAMKQRCFNSNNRAYKNYGGRGITVCKQWMEFKNFVSDMGHCPLGLSLDRIDNNKGYSPENCRWATSSIQANNRRSNVKVIVNNRSFTITELSKECGLSIQVLHWRLNKMNMEPITAANTPLMRNRKKTTCHNVKDQER